MFRSKLSLWHGFCLVVNSCLLVIVFSVSAFAVLASVESKVIADSEEPFNRRIYHYDMKLDSQGNIHILYAKPTSGNAANIVYQRRVNGEWQTPLLLSSDGFGPHGATYLAVGSDNRIHACYIKNDIIESLYYRTIFNGVETDEIFIDEGGWVTRMQLDENDHPIFIRGTQDWDDLPNKPSKLALHTTTDESSWTRTLLPLPQVKEFSLAEFLYANGSYHITYGDKEHEKDVWDRSGTRVDGVFHNFHYATSKDGLNWTEVIIDDSGALYEGEFWTSLVLSAGRPILGMYKYSQYDNKYNSGSSVLLAEWNGSSWQKKIITIQDSSHPELSEGMGIGLVVNGAGDYLAAWDFSPLNTYDDNFRGPRGNIALARSGTDQGWTSKWQIDPFSLEGKAILHIHGSKLFFLGLGDHVDSKIYFREYNISQFSTPPNPSAPLPENKIVPFFLLLSHN